jgi:hypothetical protein
MPEERRSGVPEWEEDGSAGLEDGSAFAEILEERGGRRRICVAMPDEQVEHPREWAGRPTERVGRRWA